MSVRVRLVALVFSVATYRQLRRQAMIDECLSVFGFTFRGSLNRHERRMIARRLRELESDYNRQRQWARKVQQIPRASSHYAANSQAAQRKLLRARRLAKRVGYF